MGIHKLAALTIALVLALCGVAGAVAGDRGASEAQFVTSCFPDATWNPTGPGVSWRDRPCDVLLRPQEDGSTAILQQTAAYELSECVLPNPREERGTYYVRCHRTAHHRAYSAREHVGRAQAVGGNVPPACGAAEAEYEESLAELEAIEAEEEAEYTAEEEEAEEVETE